MTTPTRTDAGSIAAPGFFPFAADEEEQRIAGNVVNFINQVDVHTGDLDFAESYILQAVAHYKTTCCQPPLPSSPFASTTDATSNGNTRIRNDTNGEDYKVLMYAQLGLGQIAAYQGRHAQASVLLMGLLLDEANLLDESNRILRMIAWYDLGMIWSHQGSPHQALGCFQEALASVSYEYILLAISTAAAASASTMSEEDYQTQERLLNFIPILMDHVEYIMACIDNGSGVHSPNQQGDHVFSISSSRSVAVGSEWSVGPGAGSQQQQHATQWATHPRLMSSGSRPFAHRTTSSTTREARSFPWSLEILLPPGRFHFATTTNGSINTAFPSDESTMMEVDIQDQQQQEQQPTFPSGVTPTDSGPLRQQCQRRGLTVQELLYILSEWGLCAPAA